MTTHWERIDWPVLAAIWNLELEYRQQGRREPIDGPLIGQKAGVAQPDLWAAFDNLIDERLVEGEVTMGPSYAIWKVTPRGLRALGEWPSGDAMAAVLPQLLARLADQTDDAEKASILRRGADVVQGVATQTLAALIRETLGLG